MSSRRKLPTVPYRWNALGSRWVRDSEIQPGMFWPWAHQVYRVIEVNLIPEVDWTADEQRSMMIYKTAFRDRYAPRHVVVRPVDVASADPRARDHDFHLRIGASYRGELKFYPDEHYPVCATCGEPLPCRQEMAKRLSEEASAHMARYETAGICPACQEPVTARQRSITFDNIEVPVGPAVTFHLRNGCRHSAIIYEERWVADDPDHRRARLSCPGHLDAHVNNTYDCTEGVLCPGPRVSHRSNHSCRRCPICRTVPESSHPGCFPNADARNNALDR